MWLLYPSGKPKLKIETELSDEEEIDGSEEVDEDEEMMVEVEEEYSDEDYFFNGEVKPSLINEPCFMCRKPLGDDLCIGMNAVHNIANYFPFHPLRFSSFDVSFDDTSEKDWKKEYLHLDCFIPQIHRPFQCMFETARIDSDDLKEVELKIVQWQNLRRKMNQSKKKRAKESAVEEPVAGEEEEHDAKKTKDNSGTPKRRQRSPKKQKSRDPDMPTPSKNVNSQVLDVDSQNNASVIAESEEMASPYLFDLSDDVWIEIFKYLHVTSLPAIAQSCKTMYYYANLNYLWESMCDRVCSQTRQVQQQYFPNITAHNVLFKHLYENCCVVCGTYLRCGQHLDNPLSLAKSKGSVQLEKDYYNYLVDNCICSSCEETSTLCNLISKTEAKKKYYITDTELNRLRCLKSPNPWHRSTAMFKYLETQVKAIHNDRVEYNIKKSYNKSKVHNEDQVYKIIEKTKQGLYGTDSTIYNYVMNGKKKDKMVDIYQEIDALDA